MRGGCLYEGTRCYIQHLESTLCQVGNNVKISKWKHTQYIFKNSLNRTDDSSYVGGGATQLYGQPLGVDV